MKSAAIYGHSQSGGMGLALQKLLQGRGVAVSRVTKVGATDKRLLDEIGDVLDDARAADVVFLYAGGNTDNPSVPTLKKLLAALGPRKTVVILPPINTDRESDRLTVLRARNAANAAGLDGLAPVLQVEAPAGQFWPDGIHLRPDSEVAKAEAQRAIDAASNRGAAPWVVAAGAGVVGLGLLYWWRSR